MQTKQAKRDAQREDQHVTLQAIDATVERESEIHRRILAVLSDRDFMLGVYQAAQSREDRVPWKDLQRKYA